MVKRQVVSVASRESFAGSRVDGRELVRNFGRRLLIFERGADSAGDGHLNAKGIPMLTCITVRIHDGPNGPRLLLV